MKIQAFRASSARLGSSRFHRKLALLAPLLLTNFVAPAASLAAIATSNVSITGYSEIDRTKTNRITVYGGSAGDESDCPPPTSNQTCNNCTDEFAPCNRTRIHSGLEFNVQFTSSTTGLTGTPILVDNSGGAAVTIAQGTTGQSGTFSLGTTWGQLCSTLGSADCKTLINKELTLAVSTDDDTNVDDGEESFPIQLIVLPVDSSYTFHTNCAEKKPKPKENLCQFAVFPGDKKVYLTSTGTENDLLTDPNNLKYTGIEIFYDHGPGKFAEVTPKSPSKFIGVTAVEGSKPDLDSDTIGGLTNGIQYYFRMASRDRAGNIYNFSAENESNASVDEAGYLDEGIHSATPDEVFGVLDEELSCFIATAAYGSPFEAKVEDFRKFRNSFLNSNPLGRQLVQTYYLYSPPLAQWVAQSEARKTLVRAALWPIWATTKVLLWLKQELLPSAQAQSDNGFLTDEELPLEDADDLFKVEENFPSETPPPLADEAQPYFDEEDASSFSFPEDIESEVTKSEEDLPSQPLESRSTLPEAPPAPMGPPSRKVRHPGAAEGLVRIDREGNYFYRTPSTEESASFALKFGSLAPPNIISHNNQVDFSDIYGSSGLTAFWADYEWPYQTSFGKFGIKFASGALITSGNGLFASKLTAAKETYTFLVIPTILSLSYRFQFIPQPWLVPYAEAGGGSFNIAEFRDDGKDQKLAYSPVTTASAGVLISLTSWSRESAFRLDSEYGINNMWLDIAYRAVIGISHDIDFTSNMIHAGITVDY